MENVEVSHENPLDVAKEIEVVTPIASNLEMTGKRNSLDAMEIKEEGSSEVAKRQKIEAEGESVEVVKIESNKKQLKIKGPAFEVQEYKFLEVPETSTDKFKSIVDLYDKYKDDKDIPLN